MFPFEIIREELIRRINQHQWPVGTELPHEQTLAAEFNVARGTVRRALGDLVSQGLIERRRKSGTRVIARTVHASTLKIPIVRTEIEARGATYAYRLLDRKVQRAPSISEEHWGDRELLYVRALHLADGQPYQVEDRFIHLETVPDAREQSFADGSPNEWLVRRVPFSSVRTVLRALPASPRDARDLGIAKGSPVFVIERQTQLEGRPITRVQMSHPGASFEMVTISGGFD